MHELFYNDKVINHLKDKPNRFVIVNMTFSQWLA